MSEAEHIDYLKPLVDFLEETVSKFVQSIDKPVFIKEARKDRYKYLAPNSLYFQILKAVSVVSNLNACTLLLEHGYAHEMGILFRSIHESITEIRYIQEAHETGNATQDQLKIIDLFFKKDVRTTDEMMAAPLKFEKVPRKKIRSSIVRDTGTFGDPEWLRKVLEVNDEVWSGYTHAEYPHVMSMYTGSCGIGNFMMKGMLNTPFVPVMRWHLASFIMQALNACTVIARNVKMQETATGGNKHR